jgi:hypothetical protein
MAEDGTAAALHGPDDEDGVESVDDGDGDDAGDETVATDDADVTVGFFASLEQAHATTTSVNAPAAETSRRPRVTAMSAMPDPR